MSYYVVESVLDRRVRDEDGTIEYKVRWKDFSSEQETWEPRSNLVEGCTDAIQKVDQKQVDNTEKCIEAWQCENGLMGARSTLSRNCSRSQVRRLSRSVEAHSCQKDDVETLSCVLLKYKGDKEASVVAHQGSSFEMPSTTVANSTDSSIVLLGELIMTEQTAALLHAPKQRRSLTASRRRRRNEVLKYCAPAQHLERAWRERFAVGLMHSCVCCDAITPMKNQFTAAKSSAAAQGERVMAGDLEILGIAPPEVTISGHVYSQPATFIPWIGEEEAERLRRESVAGYPALASISQDLLKPHSEGIVVRYIITEEVAEPVVEKLDSKGKCVDFSEVRIHGDGGCKIGNQRTPMRVISSMPLSVFRTVFPQLLIDYLLENSVILQVT